MSDVVVVGGGVIGVFIAYELAGRGATVTLLERDTLGGAASYGNAGLIVPSYSVPTANPAALWVGLKSVLGAEDAIKIGPRLDPAYWSWLARFLAACRRERVRASTAILCALGVASMALYENLFTAHPGESVGFERKGWLCVYRTPSGLRDGIVQARSVGQFGVSWQQLSEPEVRALEPALVPGLAGSIFYAADAGVNPYRLVRFVAGLARERGATITTGAGVRRFRVKGRRVQAAVTERSEIWAETFVVAAGAWSSRLLETIGLRLSMQPAKGYSLTFPLEPDSPRTPLSLGESHVVVSPLGQQLRLTGGLELVGLDRSLNERKLDAIWRAARSYLPGLSQRVATERWYGFRPLSPDGLPVIGPLPAFDNLVVATGHGTLGVTLAPITGHLVADLITTRSIPREAEPLLPSRFGRESRSMELCQPSLEQASLGVIVDQR